jgi:SAM-dependent methyltransferase
MGSAATQGRLWGARARDWAEIQEGTATPVYEAVLRATRVGPETSLLDIGCGTGLFCQMAAELGARVAGMDASEASIAIARERVPQGDLRVGDMEALPFPDQAFDVVTGFNVFQFAANPVAALGEARRVARPGALVAIKVWGKPEECEVSPCLAAIASLLPPGTPGPNVSLSPDGAVEAFARQAGLTPIKLEAVDTRWVYPDQDTALRGLLSAGVAVLAIQHSGEEQVRKAVAAALAPFRTAAGGYELRNRFRYLIAEV